MARRRDARKHRLRIVTIVTAAAMIIGVFAAFAIGTGGGGALDLSDQPFMGQANAPVTIVEFGDYDCPYCLLFEQSVFPVLKTQYIETGQAKFYFVNYAFLGQDSVNAAAAARAVYEQDPDAFWRYHRAIFAAKESNPDQWASIDNLVSLAEEIVPEIDAAALREALEQRTYHRKVQADLEMGRRAGVRGTPSIFVNGRLLPDPNYNTIVEAVDQILAAR